MAFSSYLFSTLSKVGIGSGVPSFPYAMGERVEEYEGQSIWSIYPGTKNDTKEPVTIFMFEKKYNNQTIIAQNALKRMKTLRHPDVLRYIDSVETSDSIYVATEAAMPLTSQLLFNKEDPNLIRWGLYKVVRALEFINQDCGMVHANVCPESIFVTKAGEWKLAGFELLDSFNESQPKFMIYTGAIRNYAPRMSPEFRGQQWSRLKGLDRGVTDGWQLGVLIHSIYNEGDVTRQSGQFNSQGAVPGELWLLCKRLLSPSPEDRLAPATFMQVASRQGGYFDNPFVHSNSFLENMAVKSDEEKQQFLTQLERDIDKYPETFAKFRILPELLKVMEFAGGDSKVFSVVIKIGNMMDRDEYEQTIMPSIISLFKSDNRRLRFDLLTNLSTFIHQLPRRQVSRDIFPNFVKGFFDMEPAIRDATVKASIHISPQLEDKELYELVKGLVRLQTDRESSIRTNVLICLSKLVERQDMRITKSMYQDVLAPALLNSTRDPYPPARNASLVALLKCAPHLDAKLVARRVLPSLIPAMIDTEKNVRVSASKVVSMFVKQLEAHATKMPDTTTLARKPGTAGIGQPKEMRDSRGQAKSGALGADGWGDWAVSSLASTLSGAMSFASSTMTGRDIGEAIPPSKISVSQQQQQQQQQQSISGNPPPTDMGLLLLPPPKSSKSPVVVGQRPDSPLSNILQPTTRGLGGSVGGQFDGGGWGLDDGDIFDESTSNSLSNFPSLLDSHPSESIVGNDGWGLEGATRSQQNASDTRGNDDWGSSWGLDGNSNGNGDDELFAFTSKPKTTTRLGTKLPKATRSLGSRASQRTKKSVVTDFKKRDTAGGSSTGRPQPPPSLI